MPCTVWQHTGDTVYTNTCIESLLLRCCNARCAPHFWLNSTVCVWLCVTVNRSRVYVCEQAVCLGQNRVNRTTLQVVGNLGSADLFYCVCFGIPNQTTNRSTQCVHSVLTHSLSVHHSTPPPPVANNREVSVRANVYAATSYTWAGKCLTLTLTDPHVHCKVSASTWFFLPRKLECTYPGSSPCIPDLVPSLRFLPATTGVDAGCRCCCACFVRTITMLLGLNIRQP